MSDSDFATELPRRQAHLDQLPGKTYYECGESLNRAAKLFSKNSEELRDHLLQFVGTPIFVTDLSEGYDSEAARLLINYLAALAGLRDAQRVVHHRLWPDPQEEENRACKTCGRRDPKRTKWEATVWDAKREELLGDGRIVFLTKLRDYSLHYNIPLITVASSFTSINGPGGPMVGKNAVGIARGDLLKWDGWNKKSRAFINEHDGNTIELMPLVAFFSQRVREFIKWFFEQIDGEVGQVTREFVDKQNDLKRWYEVQEASAQYRALRNTHHLRKRVEARLERAENKTGGWRIIAPDENGEWVVNESDWPPLPRDPH
jgi:hypothetical protein